MNLWSYEITGKNGERLAYDSGYETEADAEMYAKKAAASLSVLGFNQDFPGMGRYGRRVGGTA